MTPYLSAELGEQRRRNLIAEAVSHRPGRRSRRRPGRAAPCISRVRAIARTWYEAGQL